MTTPRRARPAHPSRSLLTVLLCGALLAGAALVAPHAGAGAAVRAVVPELPPASGPAAVTAVADSGRFVGTAPEREGGVHALAWDGAGHLLFDSGVLDEVSGPFVADSGYVAFGDGHDAWLWNPRRGTVRLDDSGARQVAVLGLNRTGQVLARLDGATTRVVLWTPGTAKARDLGPGVAADVDAITGLDDEGRPTSSPADPWTTPSGVVTDGRLVSVPLDLVRTAAVPATATWTSTPAPTGAALASPLLTAGGPQQAVALLRVRVPQVPAGARIVSARLKLRTGTASYAGSRDLQPVHLATGWDGGAAAAPVLGARLGVLGATGPNADVTASLDAAVLVPGAVVDLAVGGPGTDSLVFASPATNDLSALPRLLVSIR